MDQKQRVIKALQEYSERQKPKTKKPRQEREEPVVAAVQEWARLHGIQLRRYESKAIRKVIGGRVVWQNSGLDYGTPDLLGVGEGYSVAIEVKAPGKRATLRPKQREFLTQQIHGGGFAVVADGVDKLHEWWTEFLRRKRSDEPTALWLLGLLPSMNGRQTFDV